MYDISYMTIVMHLDKPFNTLAMQWGPVGPWQPIYCYKENVKMLIKENQIMCICCCIQTHVKHLINVFISICIRFVINIFIIIYIKHRRKTCITIFKHCYKNVCK